MFSNRSGSAFIRTKKWYDLENTLYSVVFVRLDLLAQFFPRSFTLINKLLAYVVHGPLCIRIKQTSTKLYISHINVHLLHLISSKFEFYFNIFTMSMQLFLTNPTKYVISVICIGIVAILYLVSSYRQKIYMKIYIHLQHAINAFHSNIWKIFRWLKLKKKINFVDFTELLA